MQSPTSSASPRLCGVRVRRWASLLALVAGALALRLWLLPYKKCVSTDAVAYIAAAETLFTYTSSPRLFPPGYPLPVALAGLLVADWELAARLTSIVLGSLLVLPLFCLSRSVLGETAAWCTALLAATYPALVDEATFALSQTTYTFFYLWAAFCCYEGRRRSAATWHAGSGALFGYAYLVRPEAIIYLLVVPTLALLPSRDRASARGRRLASASSFCLTFVLIASPYWIQVRRTTGSWGLSMKGQTALSYAMVTGAANIQLARDQYRRKHHGVETSLFGTFAKYPLRMTRAFIVNAHATHKHVVPMLLPGIALALLVVGLTYPRPEERPPGGEAYLGCLAMAYAPVFFFEVADRVFLPLAALSLPWMGRGVVVVARWIQYGAGRLGLSLSDRGVTTATAIGVTLVLLPFTLRPLYRPDPDGIYREVGQWMKGNLEPPLRIAHRKPSIGYYAGASHVGIPLGSYEDVIAHCRRHRASHLVVDSRIVQDLRPSLRFLIYCKEPPAPLSLVRAFEGHAHTRVVVYRID